MIQNAQSHAVVEDAETKARRDNELVTSDPLEIFIRISIMIMIYLIAYQVPHFSHFLNFIGSFFGSMIQVLINIIFSIYSQYWHICIILEQQNKNNLLYYM